MAKKEKVQLVSEELEKKLESNLKNTPKDHAEIVVEDVQVKPEIKIEVPTEPTPPPTKMVKILMSENHKCCIGGEWYYLLKDKQYNVPENVKDILLRANKLRPI